MQARAPFSRRPRLRAAHVTQIPLRTADLRERGRRLCVAGWDINAALQLAEDAETLAGTCRQLESAATAKRLEFFAKNLRALLDPPVIPDAEILLELSARFGILDSEHDEADTTTAANDQHPVSLSTPAETENNGFPVLVRPPSRYWQRFASLAAPKRLPSMPSKAAMVEALREPGISVLLPDEKPGEAVFDLPPAVELAIDDATATAVPIKVANDPADRGAKVALESVKRKACHLHDGSDLATAIDLQLGMLGYELVHVDGIDGLKEWLSRSVPALVMLDGEHQPYIEEIGALVRAARARTNEPVLLIAHGAGKSDLAARLRAMRAGYDAYIVEPDNAESVIQRLRELDLGTQTDPFRIMIVEDDRSQAFFAESILRKNGMHTLTIDDAADVLEKLDEFDPDLILMDLNMPVCNGIELTALIREREAFISTPIVFLSGEGDTDKHFEALSAGGDDFLTKPIAPRHLITAVGSRVKRARQVARRRPAATRNVAPIVQEAVHIHARLTDMLAMEDAATRPGGILFIALEHPDDLRKRLGKSKFAALIDKLENVLKSRLGKYDKLARSGDAAFLLLNPDRPLAALKVLSRELHNDVTTAALVMPSGTADIAIGICPFTRAAGDARAMIKAAASDLLAAPAAHEPLVAAEVPAAVVVVVDPVIEVVRKGLADSTFSAVFQPIVSLHGEEEKQFQALLRLSTADGRIYSASELVPAAEAAGLIGQVDRWMLEICLDTIAEHLRDGESVRLFVNQSASSMRDPDRVDWMRHALESRRVPAAQLSLDLRMQDAVANLTGTIRFAMAMKQLGVCLTLSGVERGVQATDMLMHLPVDFVRLSPRYADDRNGDLRGELRDLVKLAHASGRKVIAPRIEEARVAASLWSCGIDLIQGNFVQQATRDATYDFQAARA